LNVWVGFRDLDFILEGHWRFRLDQKRLFVGLPKCAHGAKVDHLRDLIHAFTINDWVGMDWDQNFVTLAMNSNRVVVILVGRENVSLVLGSTRWSKLHIDVFTHSSGDHTLFLVTDFEVWGLGRQNVQPLGCRGVVDNTDLKSVSFIRFETRKFYHRWRCLENAVRSNSVKCIVSSYWVHSDALASVDQFFLDLHNVLWL
jgi:hypothetical protein